jgi:hypothetical protein
MPERVKDIVTGKILTGDKPIYQSWTGWGLGIFLVSQGAADALCETGALSWDTCENAYKFLQAVGGGLALFGVRRAALRGGGGQQQS